MTIEAPAPTCPTSGGTNWASYTKSPKQPSNSPSPGGADMSRQNRSSRRQFLKTTIAATSAAVAAPTILRAIELPAGGPGSIQGEGAHKYEWLHEWIKLPADVK